MATMTFSRYGDWARAGTVLRGLSSRGGRVTKAFKATVDRDGNIIKEKLVGHIDAQDLNWKPLSPHTIELKHGNSTVYVETGTLKKNIRARRISAPSNGYSLFIGCAPQAHNKDGSKLSDIMIYLEYGTSKIPARPLIRPTWDEVKGQIKNDMRKTLRGLIRGEIGG